MKNSILLLVLIISPLLYSQDSIVVKPVLENFKNQVKVRDFTFNSSLKEAYFTTQSINEEVSVITRVQLIDGNLVNPEIVKFSGVYKDLEPYLSPDGLRLYFASNRPMHDSVSESKDFDIWYVKRDDINAEWSSPENLGASVNTEEDEFYPAVSSSGNLYFTRPNPTNKSQDDIFFSKYSSGSYSIPVALDSAINSAGYEFNSYISPDESFLIFSGYNREDGLGSGDLYISYKNQDGKWSQAKNLGFSINSSQMDYCPFIDWSTETLYFTSRRSKLNSRKSGSYHDLLDQINSYENGLSRIYKVDFSSFMNLKH